MVRLIVIVAFVLLALAIFGIVWFITQRARRGSSTTRRRPVAPDDDPEFLRNLRLPDPPTDEEDEDRG